MGTTWRKLKDDLKVNGKSISGKGRLTDALVKNIEHYYGRPVREHSDDIVQMKRGMFAIIIFHLLPSNQHPKHVH